ncbi:hypothetical protein IFM89_029705 [Coptis chinensis]|uniref:RRM domain-containing protein n=1 Tax=Coptis chinensis TaxID=261450 RepID=A0A835MAA3_9MAGN|nr:hypothetical protein IFM89_029705 [Coptis chinensis]
MGDAYWRYNEARQAPLPPVALKRARSDYDMPGGHEMPSYYSREDERASYRLVGETDNIGASYDRYLRSGQIPTYGESGRSLGGGMIGHPADDMRMSGVRGFDPMGGKGQNIGISGGKPEIPLPADASNTLFVEGLPGNCTRREVSHIFRPFVGFKEVRLVSKEARHPGGDQLVLCFVDFGTPAQAATAMDALQVMHSVCWVTVMISRLLFRSTGYWRMESHNAFPKLCISFSMQVYVVVNCRVSSSLHVRMSLILRSEFHKVTQGKSIQFHLAGYKFDEHDRDSDNLRLQFARYPGPRSGGGRPRGRR